MTTCDCSGSSDPVGSHAAPLVELILQRSARKAQLESALAAAQADLLRSICDCTNDLYLMQSYFEPVDSQDAHGATTKAFEDLFFYKAIDLSAPSGTAEALYHEILVPLNAMEEEERRRQSLSVRLSAPTTPPLVELSFNGNEIESDWPALGAVHPLYRAIFKGERLNYKYVHVACPLRNTKIGSLLGPAGVYLLTGERGLETQRSCFVWHLQMFVQAIVIAQLWATAEHRRAELTAQKAIAEAEHGRLERATRLLRKNFGVMREMADESRTLAKMVDPFRINTDTFDAAQRLALRLFRTEVLDADIAESMEHGAGHLSRESGQLHTVRKWAVAPPWYARKYLTQFTDGLTRVSANVDPLADPSSRVVTAVRSAIDAAVRGNRFELAFRHAKALARGSVVGLLLDQTSLCTDNIQPASSIDAARDLEDLYLRQAIVRLFFGISEGHFAVRLGENALRLDYHDDASELHQRALTIIDEGRVGVGEREGASNVVGILRGLMGGGDLHELRESNATKAHKIATGASSCAGKTMTIACKFRTEQ